MKKHFYSHLISIDHIHVSLDALVLSQEEKKELIILAEKTIHHTVLDAVLSELSPHDKKTFLAHLTQGDHESIWSFLRRKVEGVEQKIIDAYALIEKELHADIQTTKKKRRK